MMKNVKEKIEKIHLKKSFAPFNQKRLSIFKTPNCKEKWILET